MNRADVKKINDVLKNNTSLVVDLNDLEPKSEAKVSLESAEKDKIPFSQKQINKVRWPYRKTVSDDEIFFDKYDKNFNIGCGITLAMIAFLGWAVKVTYDAFQNMPKQAQLIQKGHNDASVKDKKVIENIQRQNSGQ